MADPRYSKGIFKGFTPRRQLALVIGPSEFGWQLAGRNIDGYQLYRLGPAMMRLTNPQEPVGRSDR
jgi:hypothetical protein